MLKGEKNEEDLNKCEQFQLIRAGCEFLVSQHGLQPTLSLRRSLSEVIHTLFPRLEVEYICKKITQRVTNLQRSSEVNKAHNQAGVRQNVETIPLKGNNDKKSFQALKVEKENEFFEEISVNGISTVEDEYESDIIYEEEDFLEEEDHEYIVS